MVGGLAVLTQELRFAENLGSVRVDKCMILGLSWRLSDIFRNIVQNYVLLGTNMTLDRALKSTILPDIGHILNLNCSRWLLLPNMHLSHV